LKTSAVVWGFGPSDVITVKVASGNVSPTLMVMGQILSLGVVF
jgi:hypothetical protein